MILKDKVAIITGASRGIGRAIALKFAKEGAQTVLLARSLKALEGVHAEISALKLKEPQLFDADVCNESRLEEIADKALDKFKSIDILVNNAGVTRDGLLVRMSEKEWDEVIDTNLKGAFFATKIIVKTMMRQRKGKIINLASVVGLTGNAGQANYAASKAGLIALTKTTAKEFASRKVLVNAIAPGFIDTDMTQQLSDVVKSEALKHIPLKRLGTVEDIAETALFLASDSSNYITGQILTVDGGMVM